MIPSSLSESSLVLLSLSESEEDSDETVESEAESLKQNEKPRNQSIANYDTNTDTVANRQKRRAEMEDCLKRPLNDTQFKPNEEDLKWAQLNISKPTYLNAGNYALAQAHMTKESLELLHQGIEPKGKDRQWATKSARAYMIGWTKFMTVNKSFN